MALHWKSLIPNFLKDIFRALKRKKRQTELLNQQQAGKGLTYESLKTALLNAGIHTGNQLMVHASLSKIGYIEGGAETVVDVLKEIVGTQGMILMPTSPIARLQLDYVSENPVFDVLRTPSAMGKLSEVFRTSDGVIRSYHPTEPVAAWGAKAYEYINEHTTKNTPYHWNSPYGKLIQHGGKILYIGVTLDNAGTHLHTLEDALDVGVPVYYSKEFKLQVIDYEGNDKIVSTKVHNPDYSKKRRCDELLPIFLREGVYSEVMIGQAKTLVFDAKKMFDVMVRAFNERGVTMYNPEGTR
ncbi:MAG: AAC(3) family N-acetyltransferase [Flavobacteriales bacterium]